MKNKSVSIFLVLIGPISVILVWSLAAEYIDNRLVLPKAPTVFKHFLTPGADFVGLGALWLNVLISLIRVTVGYIIAILIAVPLGIFMGYNKIANIILDSVLKIFRPIPPLSWVPLVLAWFGITSIAMIIGLERGSTYAFLNNFKLSMTFIIFLGAFFPIITSSMHGVSGVPKQYIESARVLGAGEWKIFHKVLLPAAAPAIINGMRIGLGIAWTCLVSAEMLPGSISGVGYLITHAYELARIDIIMVGMISIGVVGALLDYIFSFIERKKLFWQGRTK